MDNFLVSSFGSFVSIVFSGVFTEPSYRNCLFLSLGWSLTRGRYFVSTFIWLSGGAENRHFSCFYYFLSEALVPRLDVVWSRVLRIAAELIPTGQDIEILIDDVTKKKIDGVARYRNGAGTARQEYRTLSGLNFVYAVLLVRCPLWPEFHFSIPIGLDLYMKEPQSSGLGIAHTTRSGLARKIVDFVATVLP
ncbi:MAG: hypothetical protein O2857_07800 [Planctomycetota bacterium]|nr:hypothetical protein [Planctomycetota bacterium]